MHGPSTSKTKSAATEEILETLAQMRALIKQIEHRELRKYLVLWEGDRGVISAVEQWVTNDQEMRNDIDFCNDEVSLSVDSEHQTFNVRHEDNFMPSITKSGRHSDCSKFNHVEPLIKIENVKEEELSRKIKKANKTKRQDCHHYSRGPYRNYPKEEKERVVALYLTDPTSINAISSEYNIPIKNIVRWAKDGIERKEGAGRKKIDPQLEERLSKKIFETFRSGSDLPTSIIQKWALQICTVKEFKASKGWIKNFIERKQLDRKYHIA